MQDLKTFRRIIYQVYYILNRKQRLQMLGMVFVILIGSFFELLGLSIMLPFIQSILQPEELMNKQYIKYFCDLFGIHEPFGVVILVGIGIIIIYILKNAFLTFSSYLQASYSSQTLRDLSVLMMHSYLQRPYSFFVEHGSAEVMRGVNGDVAGVYQVIQNGFRLLSEFLVIISIAIYLLATDLMMSIGVLFVGFLCLLLVVLGLKRKISKMSLLLHEATSEQYKSVSQILGGIKDIFVYQRQDHFMQAFCDAYDNARIANKYNSFVNVLPERVIESMCVAGIIATVLIRYWIGIDVETFIPKMGVFAMGAFRLLPSISRTTGYVNMFVYCREWVESAYNIIRLADVENQDCVLGDKRNSSHIRKLEFKRSVDITDVQWRYPESKRNVLENISIKINKGEIVGIVGESGSGKSTLADILLRLYKPQNGEIIFDGVNIDSIPREWSRIIGYVPQSVFLIDDTIIENVIFGADKRDDQMVWEALKKASLDKYVHELPDGLDTIVGERGVKFSGGQRQRIAIARALYNDPQILILDEATSALDNETEEAVMEAIDALAGSMTLIIIAHRVTTLKNCDKIYEIVGGKAVERDKRAVLAGASAEQ